jgi:hypothetical protein
MCYQISDRESQLDPFILLELPDDFRLRTYPDELISLSFFGYSSIILSIR